MSTSKAPSDPPIGDNDNKFSADCPICLSQLVDKCQLSNCRHEFCLKCLLRWTESHKNCPICRQLMTSIRHNIGDDADNDYDLISVRLLAIIKRYTIYLMNDENRIELLQKELTEAETVRQQRQQVLDQLMNICGSNEQEINQSIDSMIETIYDGLYGVHTGSIDDTNSSDGPTITTTYHSVSNYANETSIISPDSSSDVSYLSFSMRSVLSVSSVRQTTTIDSSNRSAYITDSMFNSDDSYYSNELFCPSIDDSMDDFIDDNHSTDSMVI
ncbi:E3 ubiquitin-protein ligase rnf8-B-like [Oppia nitens]|uniref:E3 ubiquitin-protein ligase rnf8-B-like n=1 Tax=Oppia nitens TaxID=1686743 RepID=UPI0023D98755|nr:E3 ubiquitin-protein ligase rnf8-B-like [Oppia nitens]